MRTDNLRKMSILELQKELNTLLNEQFNMRMQRGSGQTIPSHLIKQVRKGVARIKTILREREKKGN